MQRGQISDCFLIAVISLNNTKLGAGRGIRTLKALMLTLPYSELLFGVACIRPRIFAFASG